MFVSVLRFTNFEETFHKGNLFGIWKSNFLRNSMHTAQDQEHFLGNPVFLFLKEATTPVAGFIFAKKNISSHPLRCTYSNTLLPAGRCIGLDEKICVLCTFMTCNTVYLCSASLKLLFRDTVSKVILSITTGK